MEDYDAFAPEEYRKAIGSSLLHMKSGYSQNAASVRKSPAACPECTGHSAAGMVKTNLSGCLIPNIDQKYNQKDQSKSKPFARIAPADRYEQTV